MRDGGKVEARDGAEKGRHIFQSVEVQDCGNISPGLCVPVTRWGLDSPGSRGRKRIATVSGDDIGIKASKA